MVTDEDVERFLTAYSARNPKEDDVMRPEFQVHMLNEQGKAKARQIAESFSRLLDELESVCPPCRETSVMKTKLEESSYFAKRSMAQQPENQDLPPAPLPEHAQSETVFHR